MKTFLLLLLPVFINAQVRQLTWADFKGDRPKGDIITAARITTNIGWIISVGEKDSITDYMAEATIIPSTSFTTTNDPYVLNHEKGHLYICQLACRVISKDGRKHKIYSAKEFEELKNSYEVEWNAVDEQYDRETNHSLNHDAQDRWNKWIAEQLKK